MVLKEINLGKQPIYYVQKSYRNENGRPATKNYERLGTLDELKVRFGEEDPIGGAKQYIAELTAAEKEANKKVIVEYSPTIMIPKGERRCYNGGYLFLQKIYYELGLDYICKKIAKKHKMVKYDLNGILSMPDFEIRRDARFLKIESVLTGEMEKAGYHFLRLSEMNLTQYPEETVEDVLQQLVQDGTFVSLDEDVLTLKRLMDEAKEKIEKHFAENEILTFIQVREMLSTSQRCAKLAVGYMDRIKVTEKTGAETERVACR